MFIGLAEENTNILEELFRTSSSEVEAEKARGQHLCRGQGQSLLVTVERKERKRR